MLIHDLTIQDLRPLKSVILELLDRLEALERQNSPPERIIQIVEKVLDVPRDKLKGNDRHRPIADARCICAFELYKSGIKKNHISKILCMHHSSIIYMIKRYKDLMTTDNEFKEKAISITNTINKL